MAKIEGKLSVKRGEKGQDLYLNQFLIEFKIWRSWENEFGIKKHEYTGKKAIALYDLDSNGNPIWTAIDIKDLGVFWEAPTPQKQPFPTPTNQNTQPAMSKIYVLSAEGRKLISKKDNFAFELNHNVFYENESTRSDKLKPVLMNGFTFNDLNNKLLTAKNTEKQKVVETLYDLYVKEIFKPQKGLLIGTGDASPWDIGFRLNQPHGYPYIPGSSIQGMVRSYMIEYVFEKKENDAMEDEGFYIIFGGERDAPPKEERKSAKKEFRRGIVDFEDALPQSLTGAAIKKEVFTNHYQKYYLGENPQPVDTMDPNPVMYLTVGEGVAFHVYFGIQQIAQNKLITSGKFEGVKPLSVVARFLNLAFTHYGVGARTKNNFGKGEFNPKSYTEKS